jgi:hypothetical protein
MGKDDDVTTFWAYSKLADIVADNPQEAFDLILQILGATEDENVLQVLAAGPLEALIHHHGSFVIDLVEREAATNPKFVRLLQGVWEAGSRDVWKRVEALVHKRG